MEEGGLQIRDPLLANIVLGCKLLWQLLDEPSHPVSLILKYKYFKHQSIRSFIPEKASKGTQVWKLCSKGIEFFKTHLFKIPGNGKNTQLWKDRVMGHPPLKENSEITEIRIWLQSKGIYFAPVHRDEEDSWGWGKTGVYTARQGYLQLQSKKNSPHLKEVWKQVWDSFSIPKINFFFWTLFHNKILTGENLCKRNIAGPHRCVPCKNAQETTDHLFINCEYAKKAWNIFLTGTNVRPSAQCTIAKMFTSWKASYPHNIAGKSPWYKIWIAAPKYLCWKLWLARNEIIFNQNEIAAEKVAKQAKKLLLKTLNYS
eukprot:PITA_05985